MVSVDAMDNESNASPQTWRVGVPDDGTVHEVKVYHNHLGWFTRVATSIGLATPRAAVMEHAAKERWPVVEILAPGARTAAEEVAAALRELSPRDVIARPNDATVAWLDLKIARAVLGGTPPDAEVGSRTLADLTQPPKGDAP